MELNAGIVSFISNQNADNGPPIDNCTGTVVIQAFIRSRTTILFIVNRRMRPGLK
eukprot:COSAG02_NODE_7_length_64539_cov_120.393482_25_plen_55_part_00